MRSRQKKTNLISKSFSYTRQTLIALGTPPLFALKILLWTAIWFTKFGLEILQAFYQLVLGILATLSWLGLTVGQSLKILAQEARKFLVKIRLPKMSVIEISRPKINLPALHWPKISLPKISLPKFPAFKFHRRLLIRPQSSHLPRHQAGSKKPLVLPLFLRLRYFLIGFLLFFFTIFVPFWVKSQIDQLPNPRLLTVRDIPVSTKIYDRNGVLLYQIYASENRTIVELNDLPKYLINATIAIEDKNFYHHPGFDISGIIRAALANTTGQANFQGGSTITQQLIKSALLTPKQTLSRKIKEVILAFWAERMYSKDEILKMYLNQVPYGGATYGIEAAAETYFKKSAKDLTLGQAALLAGLPSAPSVYSPYGSHPELALERQRQVLTAMVNQSYITEFEAAAAEKEDLKINPPATEIKAPHFVMYIKDYLTQKYGERVVEQGGLEVTTSLDLSLNEQISKIVRDGVDKQKYLNVGNGAALVINPQTGEILAMVGSRDYWDSAHDGNVNVTIANRSPGSSIKPLNYALALEKGLITASTVIDDSPIVYKSAGSPLYAPGNYDGKFHGPVSVRTALGSSYNIPAVKVLEKNGVANFIDFATKMGITTFTDPSRYGLAVTLGGGEVKMTDMVTAYSAFANNGEKVNLKPVLKVADFRGNVLEDSTTSHEPQATSTRVISPQTAFLISNILADDAARAPTFGPGSVLNIPGHIVSVKTGTTETKRDNWTIGYTSDFLTAVWVGNNANTPMSPFLESGNTGAAAIWNPIMNFLLKDQPNSPLVPPEGIVSQQICVASESARIEFFRAGTEPKNPCNH